MLNVLSLTGLSTVPAAVAGCVAVDEDFACAPVPALALVLDGVRRPTAHTVAAIAASTTTTDDREQRPAHPPARAPLVRARLVPAPARGVRRTAGCSG